MIKMVVSDMDGTLLRKDNSISEHNKMVIRKLREMGIHFIVATGRPDQLMKEYVKELEIENEIIMCNGAVIGHPFKEERLLDLCIQKEDVIDVVDLCEKHNSIYMLYSKDKIISKMNYRSEYFLKRNEHLEERQRSQFEIITERNEIRDISHFNKILIIEHDETLAEKLFTELSKKEYLEVVISQKGFIDIVVNPSSKGNAVALLAKKYNISCDDVLVFGDQDNDVSMFEIAGVSVAMANASDKALSCAKDKTLSHEEDGVAYWLENNLLYLK